MNELAACPAPCTSAVSHFPAHPTAGFAGTSFKHEHLPAILADGKQDGFFEIHAENYMGAGGSPHDALIRIRKDYPLSLHGVCMSIGGPQPLDKVHLGRFKALVDRYEPALVSELAWSTHGTTYFNDLLPLPYTQAALARVADHIDESARVAFDCWLFGSLLSTLAILCTQHRWPRVFGHTSAIACQKPSAPSRPPTPAPSKAHAGARSHGRARGGQTTHSRSPPRDR